MVFSLDFKVLGVFEGREERVGIFRWDFVFLRFWFMYCVYYNGFFCIKIGLCFWVACSFFTVFYWLRGKISMLEYST